MSDFSGLHIDLQYAIFPRKPLLLSRLALIGIKNRLRSTPPLWYVDFGVDYECNLHCAHCYAVALRQPNRSRMTIDDYARVAAEAMRLGTVNFSFEGGEPLLFEGLEAIIRTCRPQRNIISITTNGTLVSEKRARELHKLGVDILTFSLDSANPAEHDAFRGEPGTHAKAMAGIAAARRQGLRVLINTVVTHQTLRGRGLADLLQWAADQRLLLYLLMPSPAGRWRDRQDMFLTDDDQDFLRELTEKSPYVRTDLHANNGIYGCGAVKKNLYITPYGDVTPCPFLHVAIGNVLNEPLAEIRRRGLENPYFGEYHQKCLISNDRDFIDRYLRKTRTAERLPAAWHEVFPSPNAEIEKPH